MTAIRHLGFVDPGPLHILAIGAHADDIEIGAGGTILRLLAERPGSSVSWLVASADDVRAPEARASAASFTVGAATTEVVMGALPDGRFPAVPSAVKDLLEPLKERPIDLILAPHLDDAHQDHRLLAETVWQTFRHHLVLGYEIAKYDGDLGRPNLFVTLSIATLDQKIALLEQHFPSQSGRTWWDAEALRALARLRGVESATRKRSTLENWYFDAPAALPTPGDLISVTGFTTDYSMEPAWNCVNTCARSGPTA